MADNNQTPNSQDEDFWELDAGENAEPESGDSQTPQDEVQSKIDEPAPPNPTPEKPSDKASNPISLPEKIGIGVIITILLFAAVKFYLYIGDHYDTSDPRDYLTNTPVKGEHANIEKIDSWWTQTSSDNSRLDTALVPTIEIFLDPEGSTSGTLRVVFYSMEKNSNGSPKSAGDSITLNFENGKFSDGSASTIVKGTAGLSVMGDFFAYRNQDEKRWTVEVREAPENSRDFKELANSPIAPTIK